ncbi:MAG: hypothetical protein LPK88_06975 [Alphaproteobacteria bacterium]|nr:hypothetical protein [Alphaproteobacteria bacterium]MDX5416048.1 hypothetical protein [Alphaproteobacteria bacterium]MDX5493351.1 hypothetical protein [Alphaproteobacteria bacterium]
MPEFCGFEVGFRENGKSRCQSNLHISFGAGILWEGFVKGGKVVAATEDDIALGVMKIAAAQPSKICTFKRAYAEIPSVVKLSGNNLSPSKKRPGEKMWEQLVRNIKSHEKSPDNFIKRGLLEHIPRVGYRLTPKGAKHIARGL